MFLAPAPRDPSVFSYRALRKSVGIVAISLPFAVSIPVWLLKNHSLEPSISCYYYTGSRNLFVGSLCAVGMFMLCCRGYDWYDEVAGIFSAICAIGVAFCPTDPVRCNAQSNVHVGTIHWIFAALLFLTLAVFCLFLFTMSAEGRTITRQKLQRNIVYRVCGAVILLSMTAIAILTYHPVDRVFGQFGFEFVFESTSLVAFGLAWLTKSEVLFKDKTTQSS